MIHSVPPRGKLGAPTQRTTVPIVAQPLVMPPQSLPKESVGNFSHSQGSLICGGENTDNTSPHTLSLSQQVRARRSTAAKLHRSFLRSSKRQHRRTEYRKWKSSLRQQHLQVHSMAVGRNRDTSPQSCHLAQSSDGSFTISNATPHSTHSLLPSASGTSSNSQQYPEQPSTKQHTTHTHRPTGQSKITELWTTHTHTQHISDLTTHSQSYSNFHSRHTQCNLYSSHHHTHSCNQLLHSHSHSTPTFLTPTRSLLSPSLQSPLLLQTPQTSQSHQGQSPNSRHPQSPKKWPQTTPGPQSTHHHIPQYTHTQTLQTTISLHQSH